jgi:hypothetical protein
MDFCVLYNIRRGKRGGKEMLCDYWDVLEAIEDEQRVVLLVM